MTVFWWSLERHTFRFELLRLLEPSEAERIENLNRLRMELNQAAGVLNKILNPINPNEKSKCEELIGPLIKDGRITVTDSAQFKKIGDFSEFSIERIYEQKFDVKVPPLSK